MSTVEVPDGGSLFLPLPASAGPRRPWLVAHHPVSASTVTAPLLCASSEGTLDFGPTQIIQNKVLFSESLIQSHRLPIRCGSLSQEQTWASLGWGHHGAHYGCQGCSDWRNSGLQMVPRGAGADEAPITEMGTTGAVMVAVDRRTQVLLQRTHSKLSRTWSPLWTPVLPEHQQSI